MTIAIETPFPILVCATCACLLLPAPKWVRYVVGALAAVYAIVLAVSAVSVAA